MMILFSRQTAPAGTRTLKPKKIRKSLPAMLCAALLLSLLSGCGDTEDAAYVPLTETDETLYRIGVADGGGSAYDAWITQGFLDAATDLLGEEHIEVILRSTEDAPAADICSELADAGCELIFANGTAALQAAAVSTEGIPIIAAGVSDFQEALHIYSAGEWNRRTHADITGVSTVPSAALWVSLLIETTPQLDSVGLLYAPEDSNAVYQMEQLEVLLEEAGIPWKEYAVPRISLTDALENSTPGNAIPPSREVIGSLKEGPNTDVTLLGGEGLLFALNTDPATRQPKVSAYWPAGEDSDTGTESLAAERSENPETDGFAAPFPADPDDGSWENILPSLRAENTAALEAVTAEACAECSALFLAADSMLDGSIETIVRLAAESGVSTVSADPEAGKNALATLYVDPYNMGYQAGKLAYRVLVNGDDAGGIRIASPTDKATVKLYQDTVAEQMDLTFPKSFSEFDAWTDSYRPGMFTTRVTEPE